MQRGEANIAGAPGSTGADAQVIHAGAFRFFAGRRSDPFFGDVAGALNGLQFTGTDMLADCDVCSIVLEVPNAALVPGSRVGVWATVHAPTVDEDGTTRWLQTDRGGRPELSNFYFQGHDKIEFNGSEPAEDRARFSPSRGTCPRTHGFTMRQTRRWPSPRRYCLTYCRTTPHVVRPPCPTMDAL